MTIGEIKKAATEKMAKSVEALKHDLAKVRTGRAHTGLIDHLRVDYYGAEMPINQVANVTLSDARTISIQPFEKKMVQVVEKAIRDSDLGVNPATSGDVIRVPMPALTEERRRELTKIVKHEGENSKVAVRNIRRDAEAVRAVVKACVERGIEYLTLFAFSSENWRRPPEEVSFLMQLFLRSLEQEVEKLHNNDIRFKVVGDLSPFDARLLEHIARGEALTRDNTRLTLTVAANYGGRWDILQAADRCRAEDPAAPITEERLSQYLSMSYAPEPDLFIRTGGEQRVSNFLLWQLAYTELFFTDALWPDFGAEALEAAIASYQRRERRLRRTSEQLREGIPVPQAG